MNYARRLCAEAEEGLDLPGAAESATPAEVSTETAVNWEDFTGSDESEEAEYEGEERVVEEAPAVKVAETAPVPAPAPAPAPVPTPVSVSPTPAVVPASAPPVSPEAQAASYQEWRNAHLSELEKQYALNEADAVAALTDPEKVLPALAAKVHLSVMENSMRAVQAMLPAMLGQFQQGNDLNTRAKNLFVAENPDLADPQYEGAILQLGQVYRSMNKDATPEIAARAIGSLVRAAFGLTQSVAPAVASPVQATPGNAGFVPVRGAGGSVRQTVSANPFEQMAEEMLRDPDF